MKFVLFVLVLAAFICNALAQTATAPPTTYTNPVNDLKDTVKAANMAKGTSVVGSADNLGEEFKVQECVKSREITCRYLNKCTAVEKFCAKSTTVTTDVCARMETYDDKATRAVCNKLAPADRFQPDVCLKCLEKGTETYTVKKERCAEYKTYQRCDVEDFKCTAHQVVKRCYVVSHPYELSGPKECPAGQIVRGKYEEIGNKYFITRFCAPMAGTEKVCAATVDPHMLAQNGQRFEFQNAGDFKFMRTNDRMFACHVRFKSFGSWTGTVGVACRVNGLDIVEYSNNRFLLNGKDLAVKANSKTLLPEGGFINSLDTTGKNFEITSNNGARLKYNDFGQYANIYGYFNSLNSVDGLCNQASEADEASTKGLFSYKYEDEYLPDKPMVAKFKDQAEKDQLTADCKKMFASINRTASDFEMNLCLIDRVNMRTQDAASVIAAENDAEGWLNRQGIKP